MDPERSLENEKRASTAQLLFKAARLLNDRAVMQLREATGQDLRVAHTRLLPHIDLDGTRVTEIAQRVGVTKQAVSPLVDELVELGLLERVPDPADGRAKLVRYTRVPRADGPGEEYALMGGLRVLRALEADLAPQIGVDTWKRLHDGLVALVDVLDDPPTEASRTSEAPPA